MRHLLPLEPGPSLRPFESASEIKPEEGPPLKSRTVSWKPFKLRTVHHRQTGSFRIEKDGNREDLKIMVAGIDISKNTFDGEVSSGKTFAISSAPSEFPKLKKALKGVKRVLMEATGTYHLAVAEYLHRQGFEVVVVNPVRAHYFAKSQMRRNKTDKVDASLLCEMAKDGSHRLWAPPSEDREELIGLLRARDDIAVRLGAKASQLKNPGITQYERQLYQEEQAFLSEKKKLLDKEIVRLVRRSQELGAQLNLLTSIPGIGVLTAASLIAHMPTDLVDARQAAAYVGLTPKLVQSGLFQGKTKISKMGNRNLRKKLYLCAWSAVKAKGPLQDCYLRVLQKLASKKAALIAVAHKIVRIAFGVLKHQMPFQNKSLTMNN